MLESILLRYIYHFFSHSNTLAVQQFLNEESYGLKKLQMSIKNDKFLVDLRSDRFPQPTSSQVTILVLKISYGWIFSLFPPFSLIWIQKNSYCLHARSKYTMISDIIQQWFELNSCDRNSCDRKITIWFQHPN